MNESYDFRKSRESSVTYKSPDIENQTVNESEREYDSESDGSFKDSEHTDRQSVSSTDVSVEDEQIVPK